MPKIHAISDIHGHSDQLRRAIKAVALGANPDDQIVFLGDYINRGPASAECLYLLKNLSEKYPTQVTVLLGNHETDFLEWLDADADAIDWLIADAGLNTVRTFLHHDALMALGEQLSNASGIDAVVAVNGTLQKQLRAQHADLLRWLRTRPLFHETANQIFVHAGIDEEAGEHWATYTPEHVFTGKYPPQLGHFQKTIVAGHVATSTLHPDGSNAPFYDGASHWYIDGSVETTGKLNMLTYDTDALKYTWRNGPRRSYELRDVVVGSPDYCDVFLEGTKIGYIRMRAGMARAQLLGVDVWRFGDDVDRTSNLSLWSHDDSYDTQGSEILESALAALDAAYMATQPARGADDFYPYDYELIFDT